jgi:hypothetical protein
MALAGDFVTVKLDDTSGTPRQFADGDIISVDLGLTYDQIDVSGFGQDIHSVINGQLQAPVTIKGYLTTTPTTGTHTVIRNVYMARSAVTLEVQVGNNNPPTGGDPKLTGEFYVDSYKPIIETGKAVMFVATLKPATSAAPLWS